MSVNFIVLKASSTLLWSFIQTAVVLQFFLETPPDPSRTFKGAISPSKISIISDTFISFASLARVYPPLLPAFDAKIPAALSGLTISSR